MTEIIEYPIDTGNLNREAWHRRVSSCLMTSFAIEQQTIPTLLELKELLTRLLEQPIESILKGKEVVEFFFTNVVVSTCQKLISSKYFKCEQVLNLANTIMELSLDVYNRYTQQVWQYAKLAELISILFDPDATYFRTNNQLQTKSYVNNNVIQPWNHYQPQPVKHEFVDKLMPGDHLDVLKYESSIKKASWSRAELIRRIGSTLEVQFIKDTKNQVRTVDQDSIEIAPFTSRSTDFEWRMSLAVGDLVDCCEMEGSWYVGTVLRVRQSSNGGLLIKVALRVYCENGEKYDSKGRYNGMTESFDIDNLDVTSPRLQRPETIAKRGDYSYSKSADAVNDFNDMQFQKINGERITYIPRMKFQSELIFRMARKFIREEGYQKLLKMLEAENNWDVLVPVVNSLGYIAPNLQKSYLREMVTRLKPIVHRHLVDYSEPNMKKFSRDKCDYVFRGMKALLKRIQTTEQSKDYEITEKLGLTLLCMNSESLKRRIQGVAELKDVVRAYRVYLSNKTPELVEWMKQNNIFEKIYVANIHYELIKRSAQYFRFLVLEEALSNDELAQMFRSAQRCDHETKLAYYKIFEEVSRHMKKHQVNFIIDQILEGESAIVSCQDINLLYELEKESNYFPLEKVLPFFERIFMSGKTANQQLVETCLKKYINIVGNKDRKDTVRRFLDKLKDGDGSPDIVLRVLRSTIDSEYARYELLDLLQQNRIDQIILNIIKNPNTTMYTAKKLLEFLSWAAGLSQTRVRISIECFVELWNFMVKNAKSDDSKDILYDWAKIVCKDDLLNEPTLETVPTYTQFFQQLSSKNQLKQLNEKAFHIIRYLFLGINKVNSKLTISNVMRNNKQTCSYRLRVDLPQLLFYDRLIQIIYEVDNEQTFTSAFNFFTVLYYSQEITAQQRLNYLDQIQKDLFKFYQQGDFQKVLRSISILECIIEESERDGDANLQSLAKLRKGEPITLDILNETVFLSDINRRIKIKTFSNTTLLDLKKRISSNITTHWSELRLSQKDEFEDISNSKFLQDLNIKLDEPIVVTKKTSLTTTKQQPLVIDRQMNPKAILALTKVFNLYATDGHMSKDQCRKFIGACLGDTNKMYQDKLENIFTEYDPQKKDYIVANNIVDFFEKAALDKPSTVMSNFRLLGIRGDFKLFQEADAQCQKEELPRYALSQNPQFYDIMFQILDRNENLAKPVWRLLERLPVSKHIEDKITQAEDNNGRNWSMLDRKSPYKFFYCLELYYYFMNAELKNLSDSEILGRENFLKNGGYGQLFQIFCELNQQPTLKEIERKILEFILRMLSEFYCRNETQNDIREALAILQSDLELDNILLFLKTKEIPTNVSLDMEAEYKKIVNPPKCKNKLPIVNIDKQKMIEQLLHLLQKASVKSADIGKKCEIDHSFSLLLWLLADQNPSILLNQLQILLKSASNTVTQKIFKLIIGLTKASSKDSSTPAIIIEWLFSLQSSTNSFYLKTLLLLIDHYDIPQKIKDSPGTLINAITQTQNEYLIGGCSKLLQQIESSSKLFDQNILGLIWQKCLFGKNISCKSFETRENVYQLIIKIASQRKELSGQLWKLTIDVLERVLAKSKISNPNDLQSRSPYGYAGLKNIGNICYMLAMLQQLFHNPTFRHLLTRIDDKRPPNFVTVNERQVDDNMLHQLRRMFVYLQHTRRSDFAPHDFCYSFKGFSGEPVNVAIQQDAQQFVSMIFDKLEESIKHTPFRTIVDNIYRGKFSNTFTCSKCGQAKDREEIFYSLSVDIKNSKTLPESLKKLIQGETINDFRCDFCNEKADVAKKSWISYCPNVIIIHLQRIVFNMDTFINEKINSRFEFPMQIDLAPYTKPTENAKENDNNKYQLNGVIAHYGTAEAGHYYSFIKSEQQQWLQINDSKISGFDVNNIEAECFGSNTEPSFLDDEFELSKKEHSRNAYMLIYSKTKKSPVQLVFNNETQVNMALKELHLDASAIYLPKQEDKKQDPENNIERSEEGSIEDQPPIVCRKLSKEQQEVEINKPEPTKQDVLCKDEKKMDEVICELKQQIKQPQPIPQIIVDIAQPIHEYIPAEYLNEITQDNLLHELEINVCSKGFTKFFSELLKLEIPSSQSALILELTQKMVFKVWVKNSTVKDVMQGLQQAMRMHPDAALSVVRNKDIANLLLEGSDVDIRSSISLLLSSCVASFINAKNLPLINQPDNPQDIQMTKFLDDLFDWIPEKVAKQWQKFSQYFQFWKHLATHSNRCLDYLLRKRAISHFIDFQLQKKSPLGLYANKKYSFGNRYNQPNFFALFDVVSLMVEKVTAEGSSMRIEGTDKQILTDHSFLDKIISDKNDNFAKKIVLSSCRDSLQCSEKVAIVLLKGFHKTSYQTVQPYLEVAEAFLTIKDEFQMHRVMWVLGDATLVISTQSMGLIAANYNSLEQRLYVYNSSIQYEMSCSLLEPLFKSHNQTYNSAALNLQSLLVMCLKDQFIMDYVYQLPPPNYLYGKYYSFFKDFVMSYKQQASRPNYNGFPRQQLAKTLEDKYKEFAKLIEIKDISKAQAQQTQRTQNKIEPQTSTNSQPQITRTVPSNNLDPPEYIDDPQLNYQEEIDELEQCYLGNNINQAGDDLHHNKPPRLIQQKDQQISENNILNYATPLRQSDTIPYNEMGNIHISQTQQKEQVLSLPKVQMTRYPYKVDMNPRTIDVPNKGEKSDGDEKEGRKQVEQQGVKIRYFYALISEVEMPVEGRKRDYFKDSSKAYKLIDRLQDHVKDKGAKSQKQCILVRNTSRQYMRVQWEFGCAFLRSGESTWIWSNSYTKIFKTDKEYDWPRWTLYDN